MTMMMSSSQFGLEDMEALLWGPSSPMADAMDSLFFRPDKEEPQEGGGISLDGDTEPASPLTSSSLSSSSSPPPFYSPPPSPPAHLLHGDKTGIESDLLSFPLLGHPGQLRCSQVLSGDTREDALSDLDWMAEKVDFSDLDLDSLIGSCSPAEESPSSPEDLLASFDCPMDIDSLPLPALSTPVLLSPPPASPSSIPPPASPSSIPPPASLSSIPPPASLSSIPPPASLSSIPPPASPSSIPPPAPSAVCPDPSVIILDEPESYIDGQDVPSPPPCVPEPQEELEIKSEPASPDPASPVVDSPSSPAYTLDLGSEVDVSESEVKPVVATVVPQVPKLVLSLSPTRIVLVLAPKNEVGIATSTAPKVIRCSPPGSPPKTPRNRPYPEPNYKASPPSPSTTTIVKVKSTRGAGGAERPALKPPKDKKQKKMEQNKTAATRYRQKKRAEKDALVEEHVLLERKNLELTEKAESMAREIAYLKELMEEVRMTRLKKGLSADP